MPESALLLCLVIAIADGDTLTARCETENGAQNVKVRLAEIDAPEKRQPFGHRSRQYLANVCFKKPAEVRPQTRDRYGRTVARVKCDGLDANAEQIRAGMAWSYKQYVIDAAIPALEREARESRIAFGPIHLQSLLGYGADLRRSAAPVLPLGQRAVSPFDLRFAFVSFGLPGADFRHRQSAAICC